MKKLRCRKEFGVWYYIKEIPSASNGLDGAIYELYDEQKKFVATFSYYSDIFYYLETGIIL